MNCKQVEELLPLYVGHDLEDERAGRITAHLDTCTHCARLAEEYAEAGQLFHQFAVPQFSEATYATVRQNVLREIERESEAPGLLDLLLRPFQPRFRWAISTAVLLAVCAFAYYFVANRENRSHDQKANAHIELAAAGIAGGSTAVATRSPVPRLNLVDQHETVKRRPAGGRHSLAVATNSRKPRLNQTAWKPMNAGEPPAVPGTVPETSVSSRKPMRLEIQTKDPNIRIIWFSQPSTNEGSPNESSKGI
jgi:anti-sigma factor RsiW